MEISNVTGKRHSDVLESIRKVLSDAEIDSTGFSAVYKDSTGKSNPYFDPVNEFQTMVKSPQFVHFFRLYPLDFLTIKTLL